MTDTTPTPDLWWSPTGRATHTEWGVLVGWGGDFTSCDSEEEARATAAGFSEYEHLRKLKPRVVSRQVTEWGDA